MRIVHSEHVAHATLVAHSGHSWAAPWRLTDAGPAALEEARAAVAQAQPAKCGCVMAADACDALAAGYSCRVRETWVRAQATIVRPASSSGAEQPARRSALARCNESCHTVSAHGCRDEASDQAAQHGAE